MRMKANMKGGPRKKPTSLTVMVKGIDRGMWQTPVADDAVDRAKGKMWRTPTVGMLNADRAKDPDYAARKVVKGQTITLADQVKMFPTPRTTGLDGGSNSRNAAKKRGMWPTIRASDGERGGRGDLIQAVRGNPNSHYTLYPTPTAGDSRSSGSAGYSTESGRHSGTTLTDAVVRFPTPNATDGKGPSTRTAGKERPKCDDDLPTRCGGSLNPDWVELLMGWPKGWTSLEPLSDAPMIAWGEDWEEGTTRTAKGMPARVDRLKAIGNGQVPQCAAVAFECLLNTEHGGALA
jgi:hypothetical protein